MPKIPDVTVVHKDTACDLYVDRYADNGRVALRLVERATGEPWARATTNLPDAPLGEGEVFIKDYAENEGMLAALELAGVVEATGLYETSGYVTVPVARLKVKLPSPE